MFSSSICDIIDWYPCTIFELKGVDLRWTFALFSLVQFLSVHAWYLSQPSQPLAVQKKCKIFQSKCEKNALHTLWNFTHSFAANLDLVENFLASNYDCVEKWQIWDMCLYLSTHF